MTFHTLSFRLLYSEICSYWEDLDDENIETLLFSSPIFGDMFLLVKAVMMFEFNNDKFSSPIFGDMFLLENGILKPKADKYVFVSYIRRYVLTDQRLFSSKR